MNSNMDFDCLILCPLPFVCKTTNTAVSGREINLEVH